MRRTVGIIDNAFRDKLSFAQTSNRLLALVALPTKLPSGEHLPIKNEGKTVYDH